MYDSISCSRHVSSPSHPHQAVLVYTCLLFIHSALSLTTFQRFSRAGPRGRGREWATLGVHPLSWLLSNNRLEEVCGTLTKGTSSSRLLLSNQDKGCTPSVAHSLPLPLPPGFCSTCLLVLGSREQFSLQNVPAVSYKIVGCFTL